MGLPVRTPMFPESRMIEILLDWLRLRSVKLVAARYGVSKTTLYRWRTRLAKKLPRKPRRARGSLI